MNNFGAQSMYAPLKKVLMKKPQKFKLNIDFKKWNYESTLNERILNNNYNEFENIIINSDIKIFNIPNNNNSDKYNDELYDSIFTHDPSLVVNEGAILLNMGKKLRKEETKLHNIFYNSLEIPIIGKIIEKGTIEGGDCLWLNKKTLLVGESNRTNKSGINQLSDILKHYGVNVLSAKIPNLNNIESCFHLMSLISILDEDLAIGCISLIPKEITNIINENNIKIIPIPEDEYFKSKTLAVNILALSPRNLVLMNQYPRTIDLLIKNKCNLNLFSGNELCIKMEGGPTCLTRPILRDI